MTGSDGYALDLLSPVRHVATEMERAASSGAAPTLEAMTATYEHTIGGDLARIREHEGVGSDYEARLWLIGRAVSELGHQVTFTDGGYRLARPFDNLKYQGRKLHRTVRAGEESEDEVLRAVYHNLDKELRPFHVTVVSARGNQRETDLTLHPLAHAIPRMTEKEFAELADDVKTNGVKLPITVMGGKVIDGRHRLAVAAALKLPVRTEEFSGSEDDARRHIVSLNLIRRHLTMAQRTLIVRQVLLPEAEAEAKERERLSPGRPHLDPEKGSANLRDLSESDPAPRPEPKKASQVAAERSSGLASARSIETMAPVDDAPETQERIRRGEITSARDARGEALKETGKQGQEPEDVGVTQPRSALRHLTCARRDGRIACEDVEAKQAEQGDIPAEDLRGRITEIREHLDRLEKLLG